MPRPHNDSFGGGQLSRISDVDLCELCLGTLPEDADFNELVETLGRLKNGGALSKAERDKWIHMGQKAGLLKRYRPMPKGPPKPRMHEPDGFSAVESDGTKWGERHLQAWARPGGKMPEPPRRMGR